MDMLTLLPEHAVGATLDTATAEHTLVVINADAVAEGHTSDTQPLTLPMTGSPAFGMMISPTSGSIVLMAASSLEI